MSRLKKIRNEVEDQVNDMVKRRDDSFYKQERDALQKAIDEINNKGNIKIRMMK